MTSAQCGSPTQHEGLRDLTRAREDAKQDLLRARQRLTNLLLRNGIPHPVGIKAWSARHHLWLQGVKLSYASQQVVFAEYRLAVEQARERLKRLEQELVPAAESSPLQW